ncbi:MAG: ATP-grasp domain-containing protein [Deltaproteobacteria bacterium]
MRQPGGKVLVLDGGQPASLAIVRSLGRRKIEVVVGEPGGPSLAARSRYAARSVVYTDPIRSPEAFVDEIERLAREERFALIIPVTEDTLQPLAEARARIEKWSPLAIAPDEALAVVTNKERTFELAESLGVPIPAGVTITRLEELDGVDRSFPLVLKPSRSISEGDRARMKVAYAHSEEELRSTAKEMLAVGPFVLQSYFAGDGVGVELLADHGEVVYAFQHKRLHELPLTGGGSCLRESVPVHPELLRHASALMKALSWHGVAMVEFKHDPATDRAVLMEINGRFWGSLPLAVAAGADFPYFLFRLYTGGVRPNAPAARTGVVCRKLLDDVYWYVQVARPTQDSPLIEWPSREKMLKDLALALSPKHHFDVQTIADPVPGLLDAARTAGWFGERVLSIAKDKLDERHHAKLRRSGEVGAQVEAARSVLFLCYGNINRSALAHVVMERILEGRGPALASCGFHPVDGRPADPKMVEVARASGVDLSGWSSHQLTADLVRDAEIILAMEIRHLKRLEAEYPEAQGKAFLLGAATQRPEVPLEISDPYGGAREGYAAVFAEVTAAVEDLATRIGASKVRFGA